MPMLGEGVVSAAAVLTARVVPCFAWCCGAPSRGRPLQGTNCSVSYLCTSGPADWTASGGGKPAVVVIGDSVSNGWTPVLRSMINSTHTASARPRTRRTRAPRSIGRRRRCGRANLKIATSVRNCRQPSGAAPAGNAWHSLAHVVGALTRRALPPLPCLQVVHSPGAMSDGGARSTSNFVNCADYLLSTEALEPLPVKRGDVRGHSLLATGRRACLAHLPCTCALSRSPLLA